MSRLQLALNVNNLDESIGWFYATLFNTAPAKTKPGYANFAIAEPPLKLVLIENPGQGHPIEVHSVSTLSQSHSVANGYSETGSEGESPPHLANR